MATFELSYDTVIVDNKGKRYYFRLINNVLECETTNPYTHQFCSTTNLNGLPKYIIKKVIEILNKK